jgi:uncharacterized protein (TIRG00374 family)
LETHYGVAMLSIPFVMVSHVLRAVRWKTLLEPSHPGTKLWNLFSAVMVGYGANNIVPRSGEVLRPYTLHRREHLPLSSLVASVIVERFIDVLNLLLFLSLALFWVGERLRAVVPQADIPSLMNSVALSCLLLLAALLLLAGTTMVERIVRLILNPISSAAWLATEKVIVSFKDGLSILKYPRTYPLLAVQSLSIWLFYILPVYVMCMAFPADPLHACSFLDACVILLVMAIATTLTPPVPGGFVLIPTLLAGALVPLFGCSREDAVAYSFLTFLLNYIPVTIVGGLCMIREQVSANSDVLPRDNPHEAR